ISAKPLGFAPEPCYRPAPTQNGPSSRVRDRCFAAQWSLSKSPTGPSSKPARRATGVGDGAEIQRNPARSAHLRRRLTQAWTVRTAAVRRRHPLPRHPRHPAQYPHRCLRSEEHTSELQSRGHLVCRLLLEKKKK